MKWDDMPDDVRRQVLRMKRHQEILRCLRSLADEHVSTVDVRKVVELRKAAMDLGAEDCLSMCLEILTTCHIWSMIYG